MPRFDEGEQNLKLIKGNIVLMGNPDQYGEILAENIFVEDITRAALQTLISGSNLVRGKYYRITNAVGSTLSLVVKAVTADVLDEVAINSTNGDNVIYNITTDVATVPYADTYVPYTGATTNVDLGEFGLDAGFVTYDTTPTNTPTSQGTTYWDSVEETLAIIMNGVTQRVGLDSYFNVKNSTGSSIPKGTAVRFDGTDGNSGNLLIAPMLADGTYPSVYYMGITAETIDNGQFGKVMSLGKLRTNTNAYNDGDILYVSSTVAGGFQTTPPLAPNNIIIAAAVVNAANNGVLEVRSTLGSNINNDEGVKITTPTTGQLLQLQSNGLWENKTKAQVLGGTSAQFVKGDGTLDSNTYLTGNQTITLSGQASGSGATTINVTLDNAAVIAKVLTGLSISGSAVVSTDSILTAIGKLQNQVNALAGGVSYQGTWNASTNTPSLSSGVGTKGYYYVVSVAGSTNLDGITDWKLGDWAIYDGTAWQKVDNTDAVVSVNGYTGIVTLSAADVGALPTSAISGTTGKLAKFTSSGSVGDSAITENGTFLTFATGSAVNDIVFKVQQTTNSTAAAIQIAANNDGGAVYNFISSITNLGTTHWRLWGGATNGSLAIDTNGSTRMFINASGQIITNSASNTGEAHIFGGSARVNGVLTTTEYVQNITDTQISYYRAANTSGQLALGVDSSTGSGFGNGNYSRAIYSSGAYPLDIYTNDLIRGRISSAGNWLLGTTTDNGVDKLQVTGSATFSSSVTATTYIASSMPTSNVGLPSGSMWNDGGIVKIV